MIELNKMIAADDLDAKILLQVHDELIFEIDEVNKEEFENYIEATRKYRNEKKKQYNSNYGCYCCTCSIESN